MFWAEIWISAFFCENFHFLVLKFSEYLNRHVFVMYGHPYRFKGFHKLSLSMSYHVGFTIVFLKKKKTDICYLFVCLFLLQFNCPINNISVILSGLPERWREKRVMAQMRMRPESLFFLPKNKEASLSFSRWLHHITTHRYTGYMRSILLI